MEYIDKSAVHMGEDKIEKPRDLAKEVEMQIAHIESNVDLAIEKFTTQLDAIQLQVDSLYAQLKDLKDVTDAFKTVHEWFNQHTNACPTGPTSPPPQVTNDHSAKIA